MRIKSYFAATIREAIDRARKEMGPDAMIIASRRAAAEQQRLGEYEVVCGITEETPAPQEPPRDKKPPAPKVKELPDVREMLSAAGFGEDLTKEIANVVNQAYRKRSNPVAALAAELTSRLTVDAELGRPKCERKMVALVGPPGAGKTTTLVKLAVRYGITARSPMHIISMDGYRMAGTDALRTYAAAMGVGFDALETAASLAQVLEQHRGKGLILIDTPGLGPEDVGDATPLASLLSRNPEADVHLVLPAYMGAADLAATYARFRPFLPSKLLLTGLDMASSIGPAIAQAIRTEKPVSFVCKGQQIPEDIAPASIEDLVSKFVPLAQRAVSAA